MPLPLPNLDTRRWRDLVDEGRALIPRYSDRWTDHNAHDPGITLMELFASWAERGLYVANRIPARHELKFLELAGFPPLAARPSSGTLAFVLTGSTPMTLPAGVVFDAARAPEDPISFRTRTAITLSPNDVRALQAFDGTRRTSLLRASRQITAFAPFGTAPGAASDDPEACPAFAIGFRDPVSAGDVLTFFVEVDGEREDDRTRWDAFANGSRSGCRPVLPGCPPETRSTSNACEDATDPAQPPPPSGSPASAGGSGPEHHDVVVQWEWFDASGWRALDTAEVIDDTRAMTLGGRLVFSPTTNGVPLAFGAAPETACYVRCRLVSGTWDTAPLVSLIAFNGVWVEQTRPLLETRAIAPAATVPAGLAAGLAQTLTWTSTPSETIDSIALSADAPLTDVLDYVAPTPGSGGLPGTPGSITLALRALRDEPGSHGLTCRGDGLPEMPAWCPDAPLTDTALECRVLESGAWETWDVRPDLDAATATTSAVAADVARGNFRFGDGVYGRVLPEDATAWLRGSATQGSRGNVPAGCVWSIREDAWNRFLLGGSTATWSSALASVANPTPTRWGHAAETLEDAFERALDSMWAHERLVDAARGRDASLDGLPPAAIRALPVPWRAATAADYERIALDTPGTRTVRARAWVDIDGRYGSLVAPGAVTVVLVPALPADRPTPSGGALRVVRAALDARRTVGTRVVVMGPCYVVVQVNATLRGADGVDVDRVRRDALDRIQRFIDPLTGGPDARGWPFGRDVFRGEILGVLAGVAGVQHVESLELVADGATLPCSNVCIPPTSLALSGAHAIEVLR